MLKAIKIKEAKERQALREARMTSLRQQYQIDPADVDRYTKAVSVIQIIIRNASNPMHGLALLPDIEVKVDAFLTTLESLKQGVPGIVLPT